MKVTINGEVFDWDFAHRPLSEALALEEALHCRYVDWENDLKAGSARAVAGLVWLVWKRNGRDVPFADLVSGETPVDLASLDITDDAGETGPTSSAPEASPATGGGTSASSPKSSTSAPGKSAS